MLRSCFSIHMRLQVYLYLGLLILADCTIMGQIRGMLFDNKASTADQSVKDTGFCSVIGYRICENMLDNYLYIHLIRNDVLKEILHY